MEISQKISQKLSGENNGNHRVIYMLNTLTGEEIRFGSCLMCESYLKNLGYNTRRRIHMFNAKKNSIYGVQKRLEGKYVFRFEGDEYNRWTDFETNSGDMCFKMINTNNGEVFLGISKKECLYHFGFIKKYFSGRIDNLCCKLKLKEKGYIVKKLEEYEYKKYMGK